MKNTTSFAQYMGLVHRVISRKVKICERKKYTSVYIWRDALIYINQQLSTSVPFHTSAVIIIIATCVAQRVYYHFAQPREQ